MARASSPLPSDRSSTSSPIPRLSFHARITKASLTETQATVSTPLARSSPALATNPGRCFWVQVGVNAPGTAKSTTFFPAVRSRTVTVFSSPSGEDVSK
uniref:Uncharacterized protein n=1 Tax=Zea mays TaxID=4577 RepID=C0P8E9_MAIZE|nr:unknown [Zea mays]